MNEILAWIVGTGMTTFARRDERNVVDMGRDAVWAALSSAGVAPDEIDEFYCGSGYGGPLMGQRIAGPLGLQHGRVVNVENACSSGTTAVALGVEAIRSGRARNVLVLGIDKLSDLPGGALPLEPGDVEVQQGVIMPAVYAMRAQRYLYETDATREDLARVTVKARQYGALSEFAQMRDPVTIDDVLASRTVSDPLTLYMCCPKGDGAAALVLAADPPDSSRPRIGFRAIELRMGHFRPGFRDMTRSELSEKTIAAAYASAALEPEDIDIAEVHDAFAIAEIMYYEALGIAGRGEGWKLIRHGATSIDGMVAVNPGGGLLARGHPVGATGVAQVCEVVRQLSNQAGPNQVEGARNALTHCTGGGIAGFDHGACAVSIISLR